MINAQEVVNSNKKLSAFREKLSRLQENKVRLQERLGIVDEKLRKSAAAPLTQQRKENLGASDGMSRHWMQSGYRYR